MSFIRNINPVKELSDILLLDKTHVMDHGSALRYQFNVRSFHDQFVFDVRRAIADYISLHLYPSNALLSQEVSDFNRLLVVRACDIDRKMRIHEAKLISEALCDPCNQIFDQRADCVDLRSVFARPVPHIHAKLVVFYMTDVDLCMAYSACQGPSWSCHANNARFDSDVNSLRNGDIRSGKNRLHSEAPDSQLAQRYDSLSQLLLKVATLCERFTANAVAA